MESSINERFAGLRLGGVRQVSISAEASNARTISLQLLDRNGNEMSQRAALEGYLSSDANGDSVEAASSTLTTTSGTDGQTIARSAGNSLGNTTFMCVSEVDGDLDITITQTSGADTFYLNLILPDGSLWTSTAITFAA